MKSIRKNTKQNLIKALFILTLAALGTGLFAWEGAGDLTITGSGNTVVDHPPVLAHDGRPQTYASFRPGTDGWLKVSLSQDSLIRGVRINGFVPATVWGAVGYEQEGMLKMFPSGYFRDRTGEFVIDVAKSEIISDEVFLIFHGEELDQVMIHEVEVRSQPRDEVYYSKPLRVREAGENTSFHTSEFQINDGYPGTYWAVRAPEEWGRIHWHVQQDLRDRYPYNRSRTGWKEGFIELETVTPAPAELLKLYVTDKAHGEMTIKVKAAGTWRTVDTVNLDLKRGWLSYALDATWGEIQGIRLDVKSQKKEFGGIGEVELWGTGDYQGLTHEDLLPANYGDGKEEAGFFEIPPGSEGEIYTLTAVFREREAEESGLSLNGTEITPTRIVEQDQVFLFEYDLKANQLWEGENFFGVTASPSNQFLSVHLTRQVKDGKLRRLGGIPGDGRILNGTSGQEEGEIVLDGEYELLRVKVYYQGSSPGRVYQKIQGPEMQGAGAQYGMMFLAPGEMGAEGPQEGRGWGGWPRRRRPRPPRPNPPTPEPPSYDPVYLDVLEQSEGYVLYQGRGAADTLGFTGGSGITEIELIGSRSEKSVPMVRMINPVPYRSYQENEIHYKTAFGVTDTPDAEIRINGKKAKVSGNIFWAELRHLGLRQYGLQDIIAEITDSEGRTSSYTIPVIIQSDRYWIELEQQEMLTYTRDESFQVSGRANQWTNNLYINDVHVPISRNRFSREVPLKEGLNLIEIRFTDRWTNRVVAYYIRKVYKVSGEILVDIKNPVDGIFVNEPETHVSGFARGAGLRSVTVNGIGTRIQGSSFCTLEAIPLLAEENPITVTAVDKTGYETTKTITVFRDITPPEISGVEPVNGTWFSYKDVTFSGIATDDNTCSVFVNGHMAMRSGDNFLVVVNLAERENLIDVMAVDLAGNTAHYPPFTIKIDTTPPETLHVTADPAGWTNTRPEVFFNGTDSGIGLSHYEISIRGRAFLSPVNSPFRLPFLEDGENNISIKAVDMLGNARVEDLSVYIDTRPPEGPQNFRAIPGPDNMEIRWTEEDDEVVGYMLTLPDGEEVQISREEGSEWLEDGLEFSWREEDLQPGDIREYVLQSRDRAGNYSDPVGLEATVALAEVEYRESEPTVIEYENVMVAVATGSVPESIASIKMVEVEDEEIENLAFSEIITPVYRFYAETEEGEILENVNFTDSFLGEITYSEDALPEGVSEENLEVYYFDTYWGTWFVLEDSMVDTEGNRVVFSTDHFTDFAVQATEAPSLSREELGQIEYSNFSGTVSHDPVSVSPQSGSVSTSMTDLILPGKNGFDFAVRRLHNTSLAREQGRISTAALNPSKSPGALQYPFSFGQGWQLDLPHLKYTKDSVFLAIPGGSYYDLNSLEQEEDTQKLEDGKLVLTYQNHDGQDFSYVITRRKITSGSGSEKSTYFKIVSSVIILKDGTSYQLNSSGKPVKILDPTGAMNIAIEYEEGLIDVITDTMGREVKFTYDYTKDSGGKYTKAPCITSISVAGAERVVSYEYYTSFNGLDLKVPLLKSVSESEGRTWSYGYKEEILRSEAGSFVTEELSDHLKEQFGAAYSDIAKSVTSSGGGNFSAIQYSFGNKTVEHLYLLNSVSGPGIGTEILEYTIQKLTKDYTKGWIWKKTKTHKYDHFPTVSNHIRSFTRADGSTVSSTDSYTYDFVTFNDDGFRYFNQKTVVSDGKLNTVYYYDKVKKTSKRTIVSDGEHSHSFKIQKTDSSKYFVPINVFTTYEKTDGSFLESYRYEYDENQRIIMERYEKSYNHYTQTNYYYDDWSNYNSILYHEVNGDKSLTRHVINDYKPLVGGTPQVSLANPYIHNLLYRTVVDGFITQNNARQNFPREITEYTYNRYGQRTAVKEFLQEGVYAQTAYTYYPLKDIEVGGLKSITSPTGHVTSFQYTYPPLGNYTITQTEDNVERANGTTYSFNTVKTYAFATGSLVSYKDAQGFMTIYGYDALGRKTSEIRPRSIDEDEVKITIAYDDAALITTHTDALNAVTKYYFDLKGQLEKIEKINSQGTDSITTLSYDKYSNIASIKDPRNNIIAYGYDALDRLTSEVYYNDDKSQSHQKNYTYTDNDNSRLTRRENGTFKLEAYDMAGNVIRSIDMDNTQGTVRSFSYLYDHNGNLLSRRDANGFTTNYSYDHRGMLQSEKTPNVTGFDGTNKFTNAALKRVYGYDASGNLIQEIFYQSSSGSDSEVSRIDYEYDGLGQLLKEEYSYTEGSNSLSSTVSYRYDLKGQVVEITDGNGIKTSKTYTPRGQIASETDGQGFVTRYAYDLEDRLVKMTDPRQNSGEYEGDFSIDYVYDDLDRLLEGKLPRRPGETEKPVVSLEYDARGNLSKRIEPDLGETEYSYNFRNWVVSEKRKGEGINSYETTYEYDEVGNRIEIEEPGGAVWSYSYDAVDRLIREDQPGGGTIIRSLYDGMDNLLGRTNGHGFWNFYSYDAMNRLISSKDPKDYETTYDYDILGNRTRMTDPNQNIWTYKFDELSRMTTEINSRGDQATYAYDTGGRLKTLVDPNGTTVTYSYNSRNLPVSVSYVNQNGKSQQETFTYDEAGSVKTASLDGVVKRYNHFQNETEDWIYRPDPYGMVFAQDISFEGNEYRTEYQFDVMNRPTGVTYSRGLSYTQEWNNLGQLKNIDGYASNFQYDLNGRMDGYTQGNGVIVDYEYDVKSRLYSMDYSSGGESLWNYIYGYDNDDNMISRNDDLFGYDRNSQLVATYLVGKDVENEFEVTNLDLMHQEMDVLGEEESQVVSGELLLDYGASSMTVDYNYVYRMRRAIITPQDLDHRVDPEHLAIYTAIYNDDGYFEEQPAAKVFFDGDENLIVEFEEAVFARFLKIHCHYNEMDDQGNPIESFAEFVVPGRNAVEAYAVVSGRNEFYNYDGKGNRTTKYLITDRDFATSYTLYGNSDLIQSDGTYGYGYDKNGNLVAKGTAYGTTPEGFKVKAPDEVAVIEEDYTYYRYEYDLKNRLRSVYKYDHETGNLENTANYLYDIDGYRIRKDNREGIVTHFVFDTSGKVLEEIDTTAGKVESSIFLKSRHLARVTEAETLFYGTDHQGTTILVTDEAGELIWTGEATPFGDAVVRKSGERPDLGLKYTGKDLDEDTGLYYFNARWYDAETGRFITEDPIRDGANWYVYVTNNPLKFVDPTGLETAGIKLGLNAGALLGVSVDLKIAVDDNLNIGIVATTAAGATTPDASLTVGASYSNVDTIFDEAGLGGSISSGASYGPLVANAERNYFPNGQGNSGVTLNAGIGKGFNISGSSMVSNTEVLGISLETAFQDIEQLAYNVMDIVAGIKTPDQLFDGVVNPITFETGIDESKLDPTDPENNNQKTKDKDDDKETSSTENGNDKPTNDPTDEEDEKPGSSSSDYY